MLIDPTKNEECHNQFIDWVAECSPIAVYGIDKMNVITHWSLSAERILGWSANEVIGKPVSILKNANGQEAINFNDFDFNRGPVNGRVVKFQTKGGASFDTIMWMHPHFNGSGEIVNMAVFVASAFQSSRLYKDLQHAKTTVERVIDNTSICIFAHDIKNNHSIFGTSGGEKIYGYNNEDFRKDPLLWKKAIHPDDIDVAIVRLTPSLPTPIRTEYRIIRKDGGIRWILNYLYPTFDENGIPVYIEGLTIDVTQQKQHQNELQRLAYTDQLTGLPNRRRFEEDIAHVIRDAKMNGSKFAILFVDIDGFKYINDTLGHNAGDDVLRNFSAKFNNTLLKGFKTYRMGGDEFVVIITGVTDKQQIVTLAHELIQNIQTYVNDSQSIIHCSIGAAIFPECGETVDTMLRNADIAMYTAKEQGGRKCCVYSDNLSGAYLDMLQLHNPLTCAIRNEEFELFYQPKLHTKTGKLQGVEALIRWNRPGTGIVSPASFIPYAERSGLIVDIGKWVLKKACEQNQKWQMQGLPPIRISVNVSMVQLEHPDFIKQVKDALQETGIDSRWLELEITESILGKNPDQVRIIVDELAALGVQVTVDDFGTGYSSMQYLPYMQFGALKIDQSFIRNLKTSKRVESIVSTTIEMAKKLNMQVVAEGVEHEGQWSILNQYDCDEVQGFLIMKPQPQKTFEQYYEQMASQKKISLL